MKTTACNPWLKSMQTQFNGSKVILPRQRLPIAEAEATPNKVKQIVFDWKVIETEETESPIAEIVNGSLGQT